MTMFLYQNSDFVKKKVNDGVFDNYKMMLIT